MQYFWIDVKALLLLHEESLVVHGGSRGVRDQGLLESALMRPQNAAMYNEDADIADLAASYAYGIAKNHPFVDGNKRAAFLSVGMFLGMNGYELMATPVNAIQAMLGLASGEISEEGLASWIREHIKRI
jgi:death-on-curing protein